MRHRSIPATSQQKQQLDSVLGLDPLTSVSRQHAGAQSELHVLPNEYVAPQLKRKADDTSPLPETQCAKRLASESVSNTKGYGNVLLIHLCLYTFIGFFNINGV